MPTAEQKVTQPIRNMGRSGAGRLVKGSEQGETIKVCAIKAQRTDCFDLTVNYGFQTHINLGGTARKREKMGEKKREFRSKDKVGRKRFGWM